MHTATKAVMFITSRNSTEQMAEELSSLWNQSRSSSCRTCTRGARKGTDDFINDRSKRGPGRLLSAGIDKRNVRWSCIIICPEIENYYREIGRAGRWNEKRHVVVLFGW